MSVYLRKGIVLLWLAVLTPYGFCQPESIPVDPSAPVPVETPKTDAAKVEPVPGMNTENYVPLLDADAYTNCGCCCRQRGFLESDRAFPNFIGPISNPILAKDPRSMTEARFLFINNWFPNNHAVMNGGDAQVYALQLRFALTERLTLIADKDGIASINPGNGSTNTGLLNIGVGLRYLFIRDVENQFLLSGGFMWEPQTGYGNVFQSHGDGTFTLFGTAAKEFDCCTHGIINFGYQFPFDRVDNSSFFYTSLHLDRQLMGWLYPLVELNWFHYTDGGNRGLPAAVGEGDGLINLGTSGVAGNDLVTVAVGASAILNDHMQTGFVWETPISNREDLIDHRITFEFILRY